MGLTIRYGDPRQPDPAGCSQRIIRRARASFLEPRSKGTELVHQYYARKRETDEPRWWNFARPRPVPPHVAQLRRLLDL